MTLTPLVRIPRLASRRVVRLASLLVAMGGVVALVAHISIAADSGKRVLSPVTTPDGSYLRFGSPHIGSIYFLALPSYENTSSQAVHVVGVRLAHTSPGVRILGYSNYSDAQFGGRFLLGYDPAAPQLYLNFESAKSLGATYTVPARATSRRFAMAKVQIVSYPPPATLSGCQVFYTLGSDTWIRMQESDCRFIIGPDVPSPDVRPTSVAIMNTYPDDIRVIGCPICNPGGVSLPPPLDGTKDGQGAYWGWTVSRDDPLTATVVVRGRTIHCVPPTKFLPTLVYDITRAGTCVPLMKDS